MKFQVSGQRADGSWDEKVTTGTGFPNVFYISYHLYRDYFPLLALTAYASDASSDSEAAAIDTPTAIAAARPGAKRTRTGGGGRSITRRLPSGTR